MRCGEHVLVGDEDPTTLVLGEQPQPRGLLDQDLPRPVPKLGLVTTNNATLSSNRTNSAI